MAAPIYEDYDIQAKRTWRENHIHEENTDANILAAQNAASTYYGEVLAGTVVALDGNGDLRPSAIAQFDGTVGPVNDFVLLDDRNLFVGDVVDLLQADGTTIVAGRTIDAIDRATKTITISGAAASVTDGDYVLVPGEWEPVGVLNDQPETRRLVNGAIIPRRHYATFSLEGNAKESQLIGLTALTKQILAGGLITDIPTGFVAAGVLQPKLAGFLFW
jgi:hypothetical protein